MYHQLEQQGVGAEFFTAVDGRSQPPALLPGERLQPHLSLLRLGRTLSNTELACYLSHLRAVQKAYDSGASHVCLLEDDVVIEPNFASTLDALVVDELENVRLMALKLRRRKTVKTLPNGVVLTRPERGTLGTQAYLLNRAGMIKFLRHASTIYEAIDHVFDHFYLFDLASYGVEPHVAYELGQGSSVSKRPEPAGQQPSWLHRLAYQPTKLWFSLRRHWYLTRHHSLFYPAHYPSSKPGKSPRLRGKGKAANVL
ncbi:hypothetical protein GCM10025791_17990 [Halioxenophilus aromaticivorans]|uniref:Glycosyl transferase family 25 domain-containing protein n=1 Tax=Halioxenophilus aromaticivorans TaxID=1306992 RepID=A0AAV3U186_9ALTE